MKIGVKQNFKKFLIRGKYDFKQKKMNQILN